MSEKLLQTSKLIVTYDNCLQFNGDYQNHFYPADNYIFIVSYILIDENIMEDESLFFNLLIILERALIKSSCNYLFKLCLLKLFNLIGAVRASFFFYECLDIKHLQQDTLGYLITDSLVTGGHISVSFNVLNSASKFYISNYKDV